MFNQVISKFKYQRFKKRWRDNPHYYINQDFLMGCFALWQNIPKEAYQFFYKDTISLSLHFNHVIEWMDKVSEVKKLVNVDQLPLQPTYPEKEMRIADFLTTEDGRTITVYSAVNGIVTELVDLQRVISRQDESSRDYCYRQLNEVFRTGVRMILFFLEDFYN